MNISCAFAVLFAGAAQASPYLRQPIEEREKGLTTGWGAQNDKAAAMKRQIDDANRDISGPTQPPTATPTPEATWYCAVWARRKNAGVKGKSWSLEVAQARLGPATNYRQIQCIVPMTGETPGDPRDLAKSWTGGNMLFGQPEDRSISECKNRCNGEAPPPREME